MGIKPPKARKGTAQVQLPLRPKGLKRRKKAEHTSAEMDAFRRLVDRVWWAKGLHILVFGCEEGEETVRLHDRLRADFTIGIDPEPSSIQVASARQSQTLRFHVADPLTWNTHERFDLIFIRPAMPTSEHLAPLLKRARSLLKAEGQLIVHLPHPFDHEVTLRFWDWCLNSEHTALFSQQNFAATIKVLDLSQHLHELGFQTQQVDVQVLPQHIPDHETLFKWVMEKRLPTLKDGIEPMRIAEFHSDAIQALTQILGEATHLYWPTTHLLAWARLP